MVLKLILLSAFLLRTSLCFFYSEAYEPYTEYCELGDNVLIKSRKSGKYLGVAKSSLSSASIQEVAEKAEDFYTLWNLKASLGYYVIELAADPSFYWDHSGGCYNNGDEAIVLYNNKVVAKNNMMYYNALTEMITVCNGKCAYFNTTTNTIRSVKDCSGIEDKIFEFQEPYSYQIKNVKFKSKKTGKILSVAGRNNEGENIIARPEDKLEGTDTTWDLNAGDGYFIVKLAADTTYMFDRSGGCYKDSAPIIAYPKHRSEIGTNNEILFNNKTGEMKLCDDKFCGYIDPSDDTLKSTQDCSGRDDRYFDLITE